MEEHKGMRGCAFGRMNQKGEIFGMNEEMGKPEDKAAKKALSERLDSGRECKYKESNESLKEDLEDLPSFYFRN